MANTLLDRRALERQALGLGIPGKKDGESDELFNKRVDAAQKQRDADVAERNARWDDNMFASKLGVYNPQMRNYLIQQRQMRQDNANRMGIMRENNALTERLAQGESQTKRDIANIEAEAKSNITKLNNQNALDIAKRNAESAERIADSKNKNDAAIAQQQAEEKKADRELKQQGLQIQQAQIKAQENAAKLLQDTKTQEAEEKKKLREEKEKRLQETNYKKGMVNALKSINFRGYDKIKNDVSSFMEAMDAAPKDNDGNISDVTIKKIIENNGYGRWVKGRDAEVRDLRSLYEDIQKIQEEQKQYAGLGLDR